MESNPYTSPSANLFGASSSSVSEGVTQGTISQLERTRPWVIFMSVMAFLGAGFMILMAGFMLLAGVMGATSGAAGANAAMPIMIGGAAMYGIMGFLYIYPGIKMWKYGARISDLARNRTALDLESALNEQRVLWKFIGISTIAMIALLVAFMVFAMVLGVAGASAMGRFN
jgi:hypothetical protein